MPGPDSLSRAPPGLAVNPYLRVAAGAHRARPSREGYQLTTKPHHALAGASDPSRGWRAEKVAARIVLWVAGSYEWLARATPAEIGVRPEVYKRHAGQACPVLSFSLDLPYQLGYQE